MGDGLAPIRPRRSRTSLPGPGPRSSTPHVPSWGAGWTVTTLLGIRRAAIPARPLVGRGVPGRHARPASQRRRAPARAARPLTTPRGPRGPRASVPHHVQADVTVEVTAHSVKRRRHTGPGPARGPTRRGSGAPGLPDNALREEKPAACKNQSKRSNGWGRGVARHAATGLRKATERALHSDGKTGTAEWSSTSVQSQRSLRGGNSR